MIDRVAWDMNGTILADTQACIDASNYIIEKYGGKPVSRSTYVATFYFPIRCFCYELRACYSYGCILYFNMEGFTMRLLRLLLHWLRRLRKLKFRLPHIDNHSWDSKSEIYTNLKYWSR